MTDPQDDTGPLPDEQITPSEPTPPARPAPPRRSFARFLVGFVLHVALPLGVLAGAALYGEHLLLTGPEAKKKKRDPAVRLVETRTVHNSATRASIEAMGTVVVSREIELRPRVAGEVVWVSDELAPGGVVRAGTEVARIDAADYEIAVRQRATEVARAEAELQLEKGRQALAQREYELLGRPLPAEDRDRVLRVPQWEQAQADLDAARAALDRANLDLARTHVTVPFDALVRTRDVEPGAQVSLTTRLTHLVGVDTFWVEVVLPLERVRWIRFPGDDEDEGSPVTIADPSSWGAGRTRTGRVLRLLGDLEPGGRMARLLVEVRDPLGLADNVATPRLLIGAYVRVAIEGRRVDDAVALDAELVRDGDRAWVVNDEGRLEIRTLDIVLRDGRRVLVRSGLADGDRVVSTSLSTPVAGMPLDAREEVRVAGPAADGTDKSPSEDAADRGAPDQSAPARESPR